MSIHVHGQPFLFMAAAYVCGQLYLLAGSHLCSWAFAFVHGHLFPRAVAFIHGQPSLLMGGLTIGTAGWWSIGEWWWSSWLFVVA